MLTREECKELFVPYMEDGKEYIKASRHLFEGVVDQLFDRIYDDVHVPKAQRVSKKSEQFTDRILLLEKENTKLRETARDLVLQFTSEKNNLCAKVDFLEKEVAFKKKEVEVLSALRPRSSLDRAHHTVKKPLVISMVEQIGIALKTTDEKVAFQKHLFAKLQLQLRLLELDGLLDDFKATLGGASPHFENILKQWILFGRSFQTINILQSDDALENFYFVSCASERFYSSRKLQEPKIANNIQPKVSHGNNRLMAGAK